MKFFYNYILLFLMSINVGYTKSINHNNLQGKVNVETSNDTLKNLKPSEINQLGIMHATNKTPKNLEIAKILFKKAYDFGYEKAGFNLGMVYKDLRVYDSAYMYFSKESLKDDGISNYTLGYLHYKGFGCKQSYERAVFYFKNAIKKRIPNAMYFLGLCYRNGYGVVANIDSAAFWLQKAKQLNYSHAEAELNTSNPENYIESTKLLERYRQLKKINDTKLFNTYQVNTQVKIKELYGKFTGFILKLDYSKNTIIEFDTVSMVLTAHRNDSIHIKLNFKNINQKIVGIIENGLIKCNKNSFITQSHFSYDNSETVVNQSLQLSAIKDNEFDFIYASIDAFNNTINEPEKPILLLLNKPKLQINALNKIPKIDATLFPNPFVNSFSVKFNLSESANVALELYDVVGKKMYIKPTEKLIKGEYQINIKSDTYPSGVYFLKFKLNNQFKIFKIIKS